MRELRLKPQAKRVLRHMERKKSITALEALGVYGIFRLAAVIYDIKQAGFNVISTLHHDTNGKRYARYSLGSV
jgi:hypothetical protein